VYLPLTENVPPGHVFSFFLPISTLTQECDALIFLGRQLRALRARLSERSASGTHYNRLNRLKAGGSSPIRRRSATDPLLIWRAFFCRCQFECIRRLPACCANFECVALGIYLPVYLPLTENVPPGHVFSFFLVISNLTPECDALIFLGRQLRALRARLSEWSASGTHNNRLNRLKAGGSSPIRRRSAADSLLIWRVFFCRCQFAANLARILLPLPIRVHPPLASLLRQFLVRRTRHLSSCVSATY